MAKKETDDARAENEPRSIQRPIPPVLFSPLPKPGDNGMPTAEQIRCSPIEAAHFRLALATANSTFQDAVQTASATMGTANEALDTAQGTYKAALITYRSAVRVAQKKLVEDYQTAISKFTQSALGS